MQIFCRFICEIKKKAVPLHSLFKESCLSGRKSHTRNVVYALRRTGGSNPSLSAKRMIRKKDGNCSILFFLSIYRILLSKLIDYAIWPKNVR